MSILAHTHAFVQQWLLCAYFDARSMHIPKRLLCAYVDAPSRYIVLIAAPCRTSMRRACSYKQFYGELQARLSEPDDLCLPLCAGQSSPKWLLYAKCDSTSIIAKWLLCILCCVEHMPYVHASIRRITVSYMLISTMHRACCSEHT